MSAFRRVRFSPTAYDRAPVSYVSCVSSQRSTRATPKPGGLISRLLAPTFLATVLFTTGACSHESDGSHPDTISSAATLSEDSAVEHLSPQIVATYPWNPESFTQGVEVDEGRNLIVGTGLYGESRIYRSTLNGEETDSHRLPQQFFGEGITIHADKVWQLTWKSGTAFERRRNDLSVIKTVDYEGQGWGICSDGERLIMSDGSGTLVFRDPESFEQIGSVNVTIDGQSTTNLNELDCSEDGSVYANVWQTDQIFRIDPASGAVTGVIDTAGAFDARFRPGADVLNGVAHIPDSDRYLLTGKKWDTAYEVRFVTTVT